MDAGGPLDLARHRYRWHWHLHPAAHLREEAGGWIIGNGEVAVALRLETANTLTARLEEGSFAPGYGRRTPSPVLLWELEAEGPVSITYHLQVLACPAQTTMTALAIEETHS